jgi:hypothetical protein
VALQPAGEKHVPTLKANQAVDGAEQDAGHNQRIGGASMAEDPEIGGAEQLWQRLESNAIC